MNTFLDTEFCEDGKTIDLISIGLVNDDGKEYYAINKEFNVVKANKNQWLVDNVLVGLPTREVNFSDFGESPQIKEETLLWKFRSEIRQDIINFYFGYNKINFFCYYGSYDWVAFCQLFGEMIGLPDGWPMYCNDIKQLMRMLDVDKNMPAQLETEGNHHALLGARWNKLAYEYLSEIVEFNLHSADSWLRI